MKKVQFSKMPEPVWDTDVQLMELGLVSFCHCDLMCDCENCHTEVRLAINNYDNAGKQVLVIDDANTGRVYDKKLINYKFPSACLALQDDNHKGGVFFQSLPVISEKRTELISHMDYIEYDVDVEAETKEFQDSYRFSKDLTIRLISLANNKDKTITFRQAIKLAEEVTRGNQPSKPSLKQLIEGE
jgi:hypothetical protein